MHFLATFYIVLVSVAACLYQDHLPQMDYSVVMLAATVPAFLLGTVSSRKFGYLLVAPAFSCFLILLAPWLQLAHGNDAFFWILMVVPSYLMLYLAASILGFRLKKFCQTRWNKRADGH